MTLVKFSNANKGNALGPLFNDVFESLFNTDSFLSDRIISRVPAVNIAETDKEYQIELAVPGMKREDFKLSLDKNLLTISVEQKSETNGDAKRYNRREYSYSSFVRSFTLPEAANYDHIDAEYTDGILKISVPKKGEAKIQPKEIAVK
ncbi:MAG: Hsp20/alpha crystallin family protein [Daejeonella sp.]